MSLIQTYYNRLDGRVYQIGPDGRLAAGDITYLDDLPPSKKPVQMSPDWINRLTEQVMQAIFRNNARLIRIGLSTSLEAEFRYEMMRSDGVMVAPQTATSLAAIYQENPGKWPAVAAHLNALLSTDGGAR